MVLLDGNAGDELEERGVLLAELLVESFGYPLDVEGFASATCYVDNRKGFFFVEAKGDSMKLLDERVSRLASVIGLLSAREWLSRLAFNPLPDLSGSVSIQI